MTDSRMTDGPDDTARPHPPSDNPCRDALDGLYRYVDGEMTEADRRQLDLHLQDCVGCESVFEFEVRVKQVIATRGRVSCPDDVRARLVEVVQSYSIEQRRGP